VFRATAMILFAGSLSLSAPALAADSGRILPSLEVADISDTATVGWVPTSTELARQTRPAILPALYVSFSALQVFDGYSTTTALGRGATEANPLMRRAGASPGVFWAVKAGAAFSSVYLSERLWRQRRRGQAIAVMVVSNGIMAAVAARNASVLRSR
jgi:hypothetical protein